MSPRKQEGTGKASRVVAGKRQVVSSKGKVRAPKDGRPVRKKGSVQDALHARLRPEPDDGFVDVPDGVVDRKIGPEKKGSSSPQKKKRFEHENESGLSDGLFDTLRALELRLRRSYSASSENLHAEKLVPVVLTDREGATSLRLRESSKLHTYLGENEDWAGLWIGKDDDRPGRIVVRAGEAEGRVILDAAGCSVRLRTAEGTRALMESTPDGCHLSFYDDDEQSFTHLGEWEGRANLYLGGNGRLPGRITLRSGSYEHQIVLDAETGDIVLSNADCAEEFDVADDVPPPEAGTVLVLDDEPGRLRVSATAYDTRVAGIVSGAGDYKHAIVLDRRPDAVTPRVPVALMGKVFCRVEADSAPIVPGTLLTTSSRPGTAMAATERDRAFGAVLGKALAPLGGGTGMLPVLVTLQ